MQKIILSTFLTALFSVIIFKFKKAKKLNKWDERLAQKFLQELPSSSSAIGILRDHDFNATFIYSYWKPINDFYANWTDPDHVFNNKKLRGKMVAFLLAIFELKKLIAQHTSPTKKDLQKIHKHIDDTIAQEMNDKSSEAYKQYSEFCDLLKIYDFKPALFE